MTAGRSISTGSPRRSRRARARCVVVSPSNPTGWTATRDDLSSLLALARKHGLWIIADETYARFWYGGGPRAPSFFDVMAPEDRDPLRQHLLEELGDDRLAHGLDRGASLARPGDRKPHPVFDLRRRAIHAARRRGRDRAGRGFRAAADRARAQEPRHRLRYSGAHRTLPLRRAAGRVLSVLPRRRRDRHRASSCSA